MNELARMAAVRPVAVPARPPLAQRLQILGYLSSGTYGRVYKARERISSTGGSPSVGTPTAGWPPKTGEDEGQLCAIKKFKPDKEGEAITYTGISQSACREIMINREIQHEHVAALREVILEDKSIYLIFEYAEHDFLQIIHHHSSTRTTLPIPVLKSLLWQLLNGVSYLHDNWIIHRDLKPANILVTSSGLVKIGDLGLARLYQEPLQPLYTSDKIVVTVWYRSPELLLGARHYTPAIDQWSMGCIFGELVGLRPMFKGEEAKVEAGAERGKKGGVPFQKDQMSRVVEVLGSIDREAWPTVSQLPEYGQLDEKRCPNTLWTWYQSRVSRNVPATLGFELLNALLTYDPTKRLTARDSLSHAWWSENPKPHSNAFLGLPAGVNYPLRRVVHDDGDPSLSAAGPAAPNKSSFANSAANSNAGSGLPFGTNQPFASGARGKRSRLD